MLHTIKLPGVGTFQSTASHYGEGKLSTLSIIDSFQVNKLVEDQMTFLKADGSP